MSERYDVIVIGGGVIGVACAHYLQQAGRRVLVVDRGKIGGACSHGNCGYVCPSHVLPLAEPGAVRRTLKAMFTPNSPFSIKPRFDPALWSWLWRFAKKCNRDDMLRGAVAIQALLASSMDLYRELMREGEIACEWQERGLLFVFQTRERLDGYAKVNDLLSEHFHEPATRYDGEAVRELEPALREGLAGGWHYETDAHLRSDRLMASWREVLTRRGVAFVENCDVHEWVESTNGARGIRTSQGEFSAEQFVLATGALSPRWGKSLGCRLPIQPGKGYSITMPRPRVCPTIPILLPEHRVGVTPMESGYRLGSIMEFAGYDESIRPQRLQLLRDGAKHYLQEPEAEPIQETWFGWRPMTYDSLPIIDRSPRLGNVWIAAGHNMLGLSMAPGTGKLVAELMGGGTPHVEATAYRVGRF